MSKFKRIGGEFYIEVKQKEIAEDDYVGRFIAKQDPWRVSKPIRAARREFLLTLESFEQETKEILGKGILESLHSEVLPFYSNEWNHLDNLSQNIGLFDIDDAKKYYEQNIGLTDYGRALTGWLLNWNLSEDWIRTVVINTLMQWAFDEARQYDYCERGREHEWCLPHESRSHQPENLFRLSEHFPKSLTYDAFSDDRSSKEAELELLIEKLRSAHKAFLDRHAARARSRGAKRNKETRQLAKFEWLIRYQVLAQDCNRIAELHNRKHMDDAGEEKVTDEGIKKSNRRLAKQIGLRLC